MSTETLLLGFIGVSVSLLLIMLMVTVGDQYSRFGAVMRCALSSAMLAAALYFDVPGYLRETYGLGVLVTGVIWVGAVVGAVMLAVAAGVLFLEWLRWGDGDEPLRLPKREARDDAEDGAERKQA